MGRCLVFLLVYIAKSCQAMESVCQPTTRGYYGPKLPTLPQNFSTRLEVNINRIPTRNYTYEVNEYYDFYGNKGAFDYARDGQVWRSIYDYTTDEHIRINGTTKECKVEKIEKSRFNVFGFSSPGSHHIGGVNDLFRFGRSHNETYMGALRVRGIWCHYWRTCIVTNTSSYFLFQYFTFPGWKTLGRGTSIPVRLAVGGISHRNVSGTMQSHKFIHSYEFFSFIPGPPKPEHFQTPPGVFCPGKISSKKTPKMPQEFETSAEMINVDKKVTRNFREYYDLNERFLRIDHLSRKTKKSVMEIHDFNTGLRYIVERDTFMCDITPLNNTRYGTTNDPEHLLRMKKADEIFHLENGGSRYKYEGYRKVRSIDTDVWIGYVNSTRHPMVKERWEWHYSRTDWNIHSHTTNAVVPQIPIQLRIYGLYNHTGPFVVNFFDYDESEPTTHMLWPIRNCFWDNRHYMYFRLDGSYTKYAHGNERAIMKALRTKLSQIGKISTFRVSSLLIFNSSYNGVIAVRLYVLGLPKVKSAKVLSPKHTVPMKEAVKAIKDSITSGQLSIQFPIRGKTRTLNAQSDSYYENDITNISSYVTRKQGGVSVGKVVGITFAVIFVAVLLTMLTIFLLLKRKGVNMFSYFRFK